MPGTQTLERCYTIQYHLIPLRTKELSREEVYVHVMTDDSSDPVWPPALFGKGLQQVGEQAMEQQSELARGLLAGSTGGMPGAQLGAMSRSMATFKTRVQSGGRVSIPDAEREALDINEGDIVQTVVIPISDSND